MLDAYQNSLETSTLHIPQALPLAGGGGRGRVTGMDILKQTVQVILMGRQS